MREDGKREGDRGRERGRRSARERMMVRETYGKLENGELELEP